MWAAINLKTKWEVSKGPDQKKTLKKKKINFHSIVAIMTTLRVCHLFIWLV